MYRRCVSNVCIKNTKVNIMKSEKHSKGFLETFPLVSVTHGSVSLTCLLAPFSFKSSCANINSSVPPACMFKQNQLHCWTEPVLHCTASNQRC